MKAYVGVGGFRRTVRLCYLIRKIITLMGRHKYGDAFSSREEIWTRKKVWVGCQQRTLTSTSYNSIPKGLLILQPAYQRIRSRNSFEFFM